MQADYLQQHLDYVSSQGLVLSPEHKAALQVSLELVRRNYKFHQVYFWGKVLGLSADYFIIQGVDLDELKSRKTLYSFNCMDWKLLPPATDEMIVRSMLIKGRFMGDPSHEYEKTVVKKVNEEQTDQDIDFKIKEEERLTSTIELINREAAIIPRGAFIMTPRDEVHMNRSFEVFWTLQYERGNKLVILQNLLWPGFTFFHVPETTQFGYLYMGLGEKNMDFPFMI
ncbi:radial spoke head protein 9 homolog isoform X3 [Hemitrygon akajei]|uniref:radial spoke head protein 9 homolog isoform X3 n=1 Tax=Hemitrygon akajei TaxID=2704970 RepID=UPI003BF95AB1